MADPDIILQEGDLLAGIALRGAELRLLNAGEQKLLWSGDPQWWAYVAPILFPIVGKPPGGYLEHQGQKLELKQHGFARTSTFTVKERTSSCVKLILSASDSTWALYPFEFTLEVEFKIADGQLLQTVILMNRGAELMPASFGFHPALRWPTGMGQSDRDGYRLEFAVAQAGSWFQVMASGILVPVDAPGLTPIQTLVLHDDLFARGALVVDPCDGCSVTVFDAQGALLELQWSGCSQLGLWSLPGAPFFCIEPWAGHPPLQGASNSLMDKPGGFHLLPGESRAFSLAIRPAHR
jgi:galactose mutarotase-like enzyme